MERTLWLKIGQEKVMQRELKKAALQSLTYDKFTSAIALIEDIIFSKRNEVMHAETIDEIKRKRLDIA